MVIGKWMSDLSHKCSPLAMASHYPSTLVIRLKIGGVYNPLIRNILGSFPQENDKGQVGDTLRRQS
jgi:hypothetical protein